MAHSTETPLDIDIWADVVCPWCYIGKRRFESAVAETGADIAVRFRSFELDPTRERGQTVTVPEMLAAKYGVSPAQAQDMVGNTTRTAAGEGLDYHMELARPANTFDAHRLIHLARTESRQDDMVERLMAAYFTEGGDIEDPASLAALAGEVGLDDDLVTGLLDGEGFAEEVRGDQALAEQLGIRGVPFFVIDGRYGLSGAQPAEAIAAALSKAAEDRVEDEPAS